MIEAMKQALEALDIGLEYAESELYENRRRYEGYMHLAPDDQAYVNQIKEAITSLRQAIEQAEKQEPVAYVETKEVHGQMCSFIYRADSTSLLPDGSRLYTTPQPQREWVGLTQQDIDIAFDDTQEGGGFNEFARAIEQTLQRKNT